MPGWRRRADVSRNDDATERIDAGPQPEPVRVAVIYYSATGSVYAMARAASDGAAAAGADVRLRRVAETARDAAIAADPAWAAHLRATDGVADVVLFGTPTRFGNVAAALKEFIDSLGPLWGAGRLADKVFAGFTSSATAHGGQEATLLALYHSVYYFGGIVVAPGYADPIQFEAGNPYGASHTSDNGRIPPGDTELGAAHFTGWRAAVVGRWIVAGRR